MPFFDRVRFERNTVRLMIGHYCKRQHGNNACCADCAALKDYAFARIEKCQFLPNKPVCSACKVHCYKPAMRERIRQVMRFSGPRMMYLHPFRAILYLMIKKNLLYRIKP